jgi:carboxymethylenebutenolidase
VARLSVAGMSFQTEWTRFGGEKQHTGFLAWPERAKAPVPAVVVIQEAWGVDAHIEDVALRYAQAGYVALAPDLFSEKGERPSHFTRPRMESLKEFVNTLPPSAFRDPKVRDEALAKLPEPRRSEVGESFGKLFSAVMANIDAFVPPLVDAAAFLRDVHPLTKGAKIGAVGYCMGGGLSIRLACADPKLAAAVIYYGTAPDEDRLAKIACPVLGLYGALDERVNATLPALEEAMKKHGKRYEPHVYEGAQHAFNNDGRPSYDARAARDAFARTLDLFRRELA